MRTPGFYRLPLAEIQRSAGGSLAEERYVDTEELLSKEIPEPAGQVGQAIHSDQTVNCFLKILPFDLLPPL